MKVNVPRPFNASCCDESVAPVCHRRIYGEHVKFIDGNWDDGVCYYNDNVAGISVVSPDDIPPNALYMVVLCDTDVNPSMRWGRSITLDEYDDDPTMSVFYDKPNNMLYEWIPDEPVIGLYGQRVYWCSDPACVVDTLPGLGIHSLPFTHTLVSDTFTREYDQLLESTVQCSLARDVGVRLVQ